MTENEKTKYRTLLRSEHTKWTRADIETLLHEIDRLEREVEVTKAERDTRPVALRDHWAVRTRTDGVK